MRSRCIDDDQEYTEKITTANTSANEQEGMRVASKQAKRMKKKYFNEGMMMMMGSMSIFEYIFHIFS